jgi:carboxyl-terminal processing protease
MTVFNRSSIFGLLVLLTALAGCGGGGGGSPAAPTGGGGATGSTNPTYTVGTYAPPAQYAAHCAIPRTGTDPATGRRYPDVQGSVDWENQWIRSWVHAYYLWYTELPDLNPASYATTATYFSLDKTSATTASGSLKDKFHFTYSTAQWNSFVTSGATVDYGAHWVFVATKPPRQLVVGYVDPNSPASSANLARGAQVTAIDGVDLINANDQASVDKLNAALNPTRVGESHAFTLLDLGGSAVRTVTLAAANVTSAPVQNAMVMTTSHGPVGYLTFNDHIASAESELSAAFQNFATAQITDLVIDMRYNGGGLLDIASELAYMIAGPSQTQSGYFEKLTFNDKYPTNDPITGQVITPTPFLSTAQGYSLTGGAPLPAVGLTRVVLIVGPDTCSASESVINSLRGIGVNVVLIGGQTCGKPYGFYPQDNCGTTYFSIQFKGVNAQGFGDYTDGFIPANAVNANGGVPVNGCDVADDYAHALGDPAEARLSAALGWLVSGAAACPAPASALPAAAVQEVPRMKKPVWLMNRILSQRRS